MYQLDDIYYQNLVNGKIGALLLLKSLDTSIKTEKNIHIVELVHS